MDSAINALTQILTDKNKLPPGSTTLRPIISALAETRHHLAYDALEQFKQECERLGDPKGLVSFIDDSIRSAQER